MRDASGIREEKEGPTRTFSPLTNRSYLQLYREFIVANKLSDNQSRVEKLRDLNSRLPPANRAVMKLLMEVLSHITQFQEFNKMVRTALEWMECHCLPHQLLPRERATCRLLLVQTFCMQRAPTL